MSTAAEDLHHHVGKRLHVSERVAVGVLHQHLRRHVHKGSGEGLRQVLLVHRLGHHVVADLDGAAVAHEGVIGLDVSVDDAGAHLDYDTAFALA